MIWMYRSGKPEDPFIPITQTLRIKDGVVLLEEIPDNFQRPTVTHDTITFSEIQSGDPGATNYRIIYKYGIIVFNHVNNGELVTINYFGTGRFFLPANRVYAQIDDENNVTQSLKDLLDDNEAAIEAITTLADLVSQINEFQHMGTYDPAITYKVRNVVDDNSGNSFMAVQESVGQSLSDTTHWRPIALKGDMHKSVYDQGDIGVVDDSQRLGGQLPSYYEPALGRLVKSVAGNLDITLTDAEVLNKQIIFTGALTGNINVVFPTTTRIWHVQNLTTGEYTLGCKTASGEGIILKQANPPDFPRMKQITSDGTDIIWADEGNVLESHLAESALQINKGDFQSSRNVEILRPLVTFIDDDGSNGVLTKVKPLFTSRNVPIGIAVKGDSPIIIDENKRAEIVELQNDYGWEILSHTMNHMDMAESSREDVENDFKTFITKFSEYGLNVKSIAYPWGRVGDKVDIVSKYFRAGFGTGANTNKRESLRDYNINRYGLGSNMSSGMTTFEQFKTLIDSVKSNNEWLVFMTHADYTDNDMQLIEDVLDYVISQGIEIVTPNEGLRVFGSVVASGNRTVETKYFNIKSEGVIDTNAYILTKTVPTKIEDAPPEINEDLSKDIASINSFKAMNWSVGNGIVVEHLYADGWEYQTFYKSGGRIRMYLRKWDGAKWGAWEKVTTSPNNINYTITARTIPAFSSVDVTVYDNTIRASHHHIAQPVGVLEQGITWQCWAHGNQALKIRLTNVTDASIDIAERVWNIARLSTD